MTIDVNLLHRAGRQWRELGEGIGKARKPLAEANHLPSSIYTSEEIFALEKEKIFKKDWLAVARVEELEKPGDYMTFDIVGEPIIVARDGDGEINAFYNVVRPSRHRGRGRQRATSRRSAAPTTPGPTTSPGASSAPPTWTTSRISTSTAAGCSRCAAAV